MGGGARDDHGCASRRGTVPRCTRQGQAAADRPHRICATHAGSATWHHQRHWGLEPECRIRRSGRCSCRSIMRRRCRGRRRLSNPVSMPAPHGLFYGMSEPAASWPMSRLASASTPFPGAPHALGPEPPPPAPPLDRPLDRLRLSTWALLRAQDGGIAGSRSLATGGQLGASQAGARLFYYLAHQLALVGRVSSEVGRRGGEVAGGRARPADCQHSRLADCGAATAHRPVWRRPERLRFVRRRWHLSGEPSLAFHDGFLSRGRRGRRQSPRSGSSMAALAVTRPLFHQISAGVGVWGGAQPGVFSPRRGTARHDARARPLQRSCRLAPEARRQCAPRLRTGADFVWRFLAQRVTWPVRRFAASPAFAP